MTEIVADYVIVGSGAMGLAFADTILEETDATIAIIDRNAKPGGHWNDAYPFVRLHQPSAFYGVNSTELSKGRVDTGGLNAGYLELASGPEVLAYFDDVMRSRLVSSGRVSVLPRHDYDWTTGMARSLLTGAETRLVAARRLVDSTFLRTTVPSTHTPGFDIDPSLRFHPLNDLPQLEGPFAGHVVIGGGKTGMDAVLWLLEHGIDPDTIRWIMPRDGWLIDRATTQPSMDHFERVFGNQAAQLEACAAASDVPDLFARLESAGCLVRLDPGVEPEMFHGATVSQAEMDELRRVKAVVRMGRIQRIEAERIVMRDGDIPTGPDILHIDCSAAAVGNGVACPIFGAEKIALQTVRTVQPVFSAALIAHVEATYDDDDKKNALCQTVPIPNAAADWVRNQAVFMANQYPWSQEPGIRTWLSRARLDAFSKLARSVSEDDDDKRAILARLRAAAPGAFMNIQKLLAELDAA